MIAAVARLDPLHAGAAVVVVAILAIAWLVHLHRRRTRQLRMAELLVRYFQDGIKDEELKSSARAVAGRRLLREAELYALVTAAFQDAVDAKFEARPYSKERERRLLFKLATLKTAFGLTDRYRVEGWRFGRE